MMEFITYMALNIFGPFMLEVTLACFLLTKNKKNFRFKPYITIPIAAVCILGSPFLVSYLITLLGWNEFINIGAYTFLLIVVYFSYFLVYKVNWSSLLLTVSIANTFQHVGYQMGIIVLDTILGSVWQNIGEAAGTVYTVCLYGLRALVLTGLYFGVARRYVKIKKIGFSVLMTILISVVLFIVLDVLNVMVVQRFFTFDPVLKASIAALFIIVSLIGDMLIVSVLAFFETQNDLLFIKTSIESKYRQFESFEHNMEYINMKCHDLRKQLRHMREKKENLTDEDFTLMINSLNFFDSDVKSGSANIDHLIQDKILYCKTLDIDFTALLDGNAFNKMKPSDTYFMLLNIIDNAIDAVKDLSNKEERVITLNAFEKQGILIIEESNYYKGKIDIRPDGSIKSSKEGSGYHGYGSKSVAYIVKKYDGKIEYETKNNIFKITIVM